MFLGNREMFHSYDLSGLLVTYQVQRISVENRMMKYRFSDIRQNILWSVG